MNRVIGLVIMISVASIGVAHAITIKVSDSCIVHESNNQNIIDSFVEDVIFLLPDELTTVLCKNYDALLDGARFKLPEAYWKHKVVDEKIFKERFYSIAKTYKETESDSILAKRLGGTIVDIVEVAMKTGKYDPLNDGLKRNISEFLLNGSNGTYQVTYTGLHNHSFDGTVDTLYGLYRYDKSSLYPELVTVTARLWTSVWVATGHSDILTKQSFVRRQVQLNGMIAWTEIADNEGGVTRIRDAKEASIVVSNINNSNSTIKNKIIQKRINENIQAMIVQDRAEAAHMDYKRVKGLGEDRSIITTSDLLEAKNMERGLRKNPVIQKLSANLDICSNSNDCDSLESYLLMN